jgi:hypothetical protein
MALPLLRFRGHAEDVRVRRDDGRAVVENRGRRQVSVEWLWPYDGPAGQQGGFAILKPGRTVSFAIAGRPFRPGPG